MQLNIKGVGRILVWLGGSLTLFAFSGAASMTPSLSSYAQFYYLAAAGISLALGGLLAQI